MDMLLYAILNKKIKIVVELAARLFMFITAQSMTMETLSSHYQTDQLLMLDKQKAMME